MSTYVYKVITKEGKEKKGTIDTDNRQKAMVSLRSEGNTIISLEEGSALNKDIQIGRKKVKSRDLSVFCRQFNSLLSAGVGVVPALNMLSEQTGNKTMRESILNVYANVQKGDTLANAMKKEGPDVFPDILVSMINAGEASGSMEKSLANMAEHFEKDTRIKGMLKKAMIYPIVLLVVAVVVLVIMVVAVLPSFAEMFADLDSDLPFLTRALLSLSDFIKTKWYILIAIIVAIVSGVKIFSSSATGKRTMATLKTKIPVFGNLTMKSESARFSRTFATMMASGMSMVEAMTITSKTMENLLYKEALEETIIQIQRGVPLSQPLQKSGLFPPLIIHMTGIGEETGSLEEMLMNCARYYDEETELATQQIMSLLEPMIIIVMAGIVCVILGAIYGPITSMYDTLGGL